MTNKTPIQELKDWMDNQPQVWGEVMDKIEDALEKERKMVIDTYSNGFSSGKWQTDGNDSIYHAKKYFNQRYGK